MRTGATLLAGLLESPDFGSGSGGVDSAGSNLDVWCSHFGACQGNDAFLNMAAPAWPSVHCVAAHSCKDFELHCGAAGCRVDCAEELACSNISVGCLGRSVVVISSTYECSASAVIDLQIDPQAAAKTALADARAALAGITAATPGPTTLWTEFACSGRCAVQAACASGTCGCCTFDRTGDRCLWADGGRLTSLPASGGKKSADCSAGACGAFTPVTCSVDGVPLGLYAANCNASAAPLHGARGSCTAVVPSGTTCQPTCDKGYAPTGSTSCWDGVLTAAQCKLQTAAPSRVPSPPPALTSTPTPLPTDTPTPAPTTTPSQASTADPSWAPTAPTPLPTLSPSFKPSWDPSFSPSASPSAFPTTVAPSLPPTTRRVLLASASMASSGESRFSSPLRPMVVEGTELSFDLSLASDGEPGLLSQLH